jgi:hypothetical protein
MNAETTDDRSDNKEETVSTHYRTIAPISRLAMLSWQVTVLHIHVYRSAHTVLHVSI